MNTTKEQRKRCRLMSITGVFSQSGKVNKAQQKDSDDMANLHIFSDL